jgi:acid phosphatase (class A)
MWSTFTLVRIVTAIRHFFPNRFSISSSAAAIAIFVVMTEVPLTVSVNVAKAQSAGVLEISPGFLAGYLSAKALPDSLALIPPPPAAGTAAFALDEELSRMNLELRGTPRWTLATQDADLMFPHAAGTFTCALNIPITELDTPHLYILLRRSLTDAGLSIKAAKKYYSRARPFAVNKEPICTPWDEPYLMDDTSYPSAHSAIGWAWGLVLSEVAPDQADKILARSRAFGQSREVCNVHWASDVIEGRIVGAAAVARLHTDSTFLADLDAAKTELAAVRAKRLIPTRNCDAEAAEMSLDPPRALPELLKRTN